MSYFEDQLNADRSLNELQQLIESIYGWMDKSRYHNEHTRERFNHVRKTLADQHRNVLFLAETSRGKSELINATIFGNLGSRFLPSSPGRTTRCTTVLEYQQSRLPSVRLLPVRATKNIQHQPLSMLLDEESVWQHTLFSMKEKKEIKKSLNQIAEFERVTPEVAKSLGFLSDLEGKTLDNLDMVDGMVSIPKWRHAIINYPHSLLKQGLRIIDTPGLNALGAEPELTYQALESSHAIVFVVSADTGVTRSEYQTWRDHVRGGNTSNVIVVINKIDLLWDELKSRAEIDRDIKKQIREVSRILNVRPDQVFPVSAQKALVGRARGDMKLVTASGIQRYEQALADTINTTNQKRILDQAIREISPTLTIIRGILKRRIDDTGSHIKELDSNHSNQVSLMQSSEEKVVRDVNKHDKARDYIFALKQDLQAGYTQFIRHLDLVYLDRMIASYRYEISNQLTTPGLQREMNDFHAVAIDRFQVALSYVLRLQQKIEKTFVVVEKILNVDGLTARKFEPHIYIDALKNFQTSHAKHSKGFGMVLTEQHILRDRYHASVMVKIRKLYKQTRDDVDRWCRTVLVPLELELKERATEIRKRQESLGRIKNKESRVVDEIAQLEQSSRLLDQRTNTIDHFARRLSECSERNSKYPGNVVNLHTSAASRGAG
jgi:hypothetical protein